MEMPLSLPVAVRELLLIHGHLREGPVLPAPDYREVLYIQ